MVAAIEDPTTADLWRRCYIASTEDEAHAQALRQFEAFDGKTILAYTVTGKLTERDGWEADIDISGGVPVVVVDVLSLESWDGETLYPEWRIRPVDPDQQVTDDRGRTFVIGAVIDLGFTAPGIGSREGFAHHGDDHTRIEPEAP